MAWGVWCGYLSGVNIRPLVGPIRNEDYGRFIAQDVVGWARAEVPSLRVGGHLLCGLSLSATRMLLSRRWVHLRARTRHPRW